MDFDFNVVTRNGQNAVVTLNDIFIDYRDFRKYCTEAICVDVIEKIKTASGKKCAVVFGNCQVGKIFNMLMNNIQFQNEYLLIILPRVFDFKPEEVAEIFDETDGRIFEICDLFISQYIKETNRFNARLSTKSIFQKLRDNARFIVIPNLYFAGYFPQLKTEQENFSDLEKIFPTEDKYVDEIMSRSEMNPDVEKILDRICDENFLSPDEMQAAVDKSLTEYKKREWLCDIKMADFIENNFCDQQICYSPNHPLPFVIFELVRRILKFIDIRSESFWDHKNMFDNENRVYSLIGQDTPIYPAVKKYLNLPIRIDQYYANDAKWDLYANFRDYMRQYLLHCWHEKFSR